MIVFHEGLPRSGKSYEALVQVVAWLKEGKKVVTNISGINTEKISGYTGIPEAALKNQIRVITDDEVREIWKAVPLPEDDGKGEKDLHIVIDELQDFFPVGRERPSKELSRWVSSHGHAGWHILAMGQDLRDCHNIWKRRVQRKIVFTKQTALGREGHYKWELYEAIAPEKFRTMGSGSKKYDSAYFGMYASHVEGTEQTGALMDKRGIIWHHPGFKYGVPLAILTAIYAVYHLSGFFKGEEALQKPQYYQQVKQKNIVDKKNVGKQTEKEEEPPPIDYVDKLANKHKLRLAGVIDGADGMMLASIEVMNSTFHLKERFTVSDLEAMGWKVERTGYGLKIVKAAKGRVVEHVVRGWPVDPFGRVANRTRESKTVGATTSGSQK